MFLIEEISYKNYSDFYEDNYDDALRIKKILEDNFSFFKKNEEQWDEERDEAESIWNCMTLSDEDRKRKVLEIDKKFGYNEKYSDRYIVRIREIVKYKG